MSESTSETKSSITWMGDGYLINLPTMKGLVRFKLEDMQQERSRELNARVTTWTEFPGEPLEPFLARLNILSMSQVNQYRLNLERQFPTLERGDWQVITNRMVSMTLKSWESRERETSFNKISLNGTGSSPHLLPPLLVRGANVIFGPGDSGKTWLALALARTYVNGGEVARLQWSEAGPALYIDYESDEATMRQRLDLLGPSLDELYYWPGEGVPLADSVPGLLKVIKTRDIGFIVVDSAGLACGGEPEKAEMAIRYFNALQKLGVPSLTIAHLRKDGEQDNSPFGSVYWQTSARQIWKISSDQDDGHEREMGLTHMKWNNVPERARPLGIRLVTGSEAVTLDWCPYGEVFEGDLTDRQRIRLVLSRGGKMTVLQISEEMEIGANAVRVTLKRMGRDVAQSNETPPEWWLVDKR